MLCTIQWLIMGYYNSASCYGLYRIGISCVSPFISSLTSVCSVKVSHMTDSVDTALGAMPPPLFKLSTVICMSVESKKLTSQQII